jgi:hypothetical protein
MTAMAQALQSLCLTSRNRQFSLHQRDPSMTRSFSTARVLQIKQPCNRNDSKLKLSGVSMSRNRNSPACTNRISLLLADLLLQVLGTIKQDLHNNKLTKLNKTSMHALSSRNQASVIHGTSTPRTMSST